MKILHLVFHPDLKASRCNRIWREQFIESGKLSLSRDIYREYSDFQIDVAREQELLLAHDRIVIQFPLYWYSATPLLKKWLDDVLTYGFAYGSTGNQLHGKQLQIITSVGGQPKYYSGFDVYATVHELLRPFQLTAKLCGMTYQIPVWMYHADSASEAIIRQHGEQWVASIDDPTLAKPDRYLATLES